jgi:predicted dienelactone hydrolase
MLRKITAAALITGAVLVGLMAQAGSYLLALPTLVGGAPNGTESASIAVDGPHAVGVGTLSDYEAPIPMTVWYPALEEPTRAATTYSYAINMLGPETTTALATYRGEARHGLAGDRSGGPYPLVILSHGFAITAGSYGWLAEHLASWGFVVVAPHHRESLDPGTLWRSSIERPRDVETTVAFIEETGGAGAGLDGMIDTGAVAVVGHSYGGYTALAAAGARIDPEAFQASCALASRVDDPLMFLCDALTPRLDEMGRLAGVDSPKTATWPPLFDHGVDAVVAIAGDAAMFGESGLAEITVPVLAIGGTADTDSPFEWGTRLTYEQVASPRKVEVALQGAGHMIFAGGCDSVRRVMSIAPLGFCSDPAWNRDEAHDLVKRYVATFLVAELLGDQEAAAELVAGDRSLPNIEFRSQGYGTGAGA